MVSKKYNKCRCCYTSLKSYVNKSIDPHMFASVCRCQNKEKIEMWIVLKIVIGLCNICIIGIGDWLCYVWFVALQHSNLFLLNLPVPCTSEDSVNQNTSSNLLH
jgi:hypothetical protein